MAARVGSSGSAFSLTELSSLLLSYTLPSRLGRNFSISFKSGREAKGDVWSKLPSILTFEISGGTGVYSLGGSPAILCFIWMAAAP